MLAYQFPICEYYNSLLTLAYSIPYVCDVIFYLDGD